MYVLCVHCPLVMFVTCTVMHCGIVVLPMLCECLHGNRIKLLVQFRQQQLSDLQDVRDRMDVEMQQEKRVEQKLRVCSGIEVSSTGDLHVTCM